MTQEKKMNQMMMTEVDVLGGILAQIKDLTNQADAIKDQFKDIATLPNGAKVFEGLLFKATVIPANVNLVDYKRMMIDLGVSAATIEQYTSVSARFAVKTTSR